MQALNLYKVFNLGFFRIPDYQRGYSWTDKQLNELWDDLDEIQEIDGELKKHYTGTFFLEKTKATEQEKWIEDDFFFVVDGQQRLTTISILLFELLRYDTGYSNKTKELLVDTFLHVKSETGNSRVERFGYQETDRNYQYLNRVIFEDENILLPTNQKNLYSKNLSNAKTFFNDKIKNLSEDDRRLLFKKLTTCLVFDIRKIEKDLDVQAVFETMNNRGKPLTTLEKLKNRLIFLNEKIKQSDSDKTILRTNINSAWGKIYNSLAQNPDHFLDEDEFLSAHLSLYRKPKESVFSEKLAEEKIFQMFCNKSENFDEDETQKKELPVTHSKISQYIHNLSDTAPTWYNVNFPKDVIVQKILIMNSSKDVKIFLTAIFNKIKEPSTQKSLLISLEKILFRNRVPGLWVMDERNTSTWARNLYTTKDISTSIIDIQAEMMEYLLKKIHNEDMISGFQSLFTYVRGAVGFHRWGNLKYFLFEYDEKLKKEFNEGNDKVSLNDFESTSVEHVIPREYEAYWSNEVNEIVDQFESDHERYLAQKVVINSLGNLTILKNGKNSSLKNYGWDLKKQRYETGSYNEIEISKQLHWSKKEISARGYKLLLFLMEKIDGLNLSDDEINNCLYYNDEIIDVATTIATKSIISDEV
ncbi:DUF262 domain-containing protein [Chryseobacterium profundimaris]|uniref:Uncharacterized conserved protein, contains ParB-like and HNH nuclease domains n=1 Tax=Chryseobacterium profundimaris TaxID=1387275 RepID=A0ABY1NTP9_9FLAO|nr:DUF262 domain-containing HNH endonuclease family protein [Chryseobacterium profundimaris]SMP18000.1 Uncharacterized conserved protein, contains ParB-like and HNH nuclease domains [Chryseobacterium profundimaris]